MNKKWLLIVMFLTSLLLVGCSDSTLDEKAKRYVVKEATQVAVHHFEQTEKKDVILMGHTFDKEGEREIIFLNGYEKQDPEHKREIALAYNDGFSIVHVQ
jgi:hypothetical protein